MMEPSKLTPDQVKAKLDTGEPVTFLDDRSPKDWDASDVKIPGALRVPPAEADQHLAELGAAPRNAIIVTYCT
jgi:rhodanese-related sulfurtransferase